MLSSEKISFVLLNKFAFFRAFIHLQGFATSVTNEKTEKMEIANALLSCRLDIGLNDYYDLFILKCNNVLILNEIVFYFTRVFVFIRYRRE